MLAARSLARLTVPGSLVLAMVAPASGAVADGDPSSAGRRGDALERIEFLANIASLDGASTLLDPRNPDAEPDWSIEHPFPIGKTDRDPLLGSPLEPVLRPWRTVDQAAVDRLGLYSSIYYTLLYQHVVDPVPDTPRNLGTGRLDVNLVWNLWDEDSRDGRAAGPGGHGLVGFLVRQGNQIGVSQGQSTAASVGSIEGLNSLYFGPEGSPATLNLLYFQQGWDDDRFVVSAGKIHPNQYIALNFWADDESRQFLAGPFDGIQTVGSSLGGYQLGVAVQSVPTDDLFLNAIVTDALGRPDSMFGTIGEGYVWSAVELGWALPVDEERLGGPCLASVIWSGQNLDALASQPERRWSNAIAGQLQLHLTSQLGFWVQGGWCEPNMSTTTAQVSTGLGVQQPFGRRGDLCGIAYNWSRPTSAAGTTGAAASSGDTLVGLGFDRTNPLAGPVLESQSMIEAFYRIQITGSMQLTPDIQVVFDPGMRSDSKTSVVLGLRLTTDF